MTRRDFMVSAIGAGLAVGLDSPSSAAGCCRPVPVPRFCINPSTIRGYRLTLREQVRLAIAAGYNGIEPWLSDLAAAKSAGELADIRKMCEDGGLAVVNGIGFAHWALPDSAARAKGLEEMKRDMALVAEAGGSYIAAPPFGLQQPGAPKIAVEDFIPRYQAVLALGDEMGVAPVLEFWGHSTNLSTLPEAVRIASASGHPKASVLADVYHMYRGGSPYEGLRFLTASTLPVLHMNDVPASPARAQLKDADRVWPGDGVAPFRQIFGILRENDVSPWLSLELFNPNYWKSTPLETLKTGLERMKRVVA